MYANEDSMHLDKTPGEVESPTKLIPACPQEEQPQLPVLLKLFLWLQRRLKDKLTFPEIENLATAEFKSAAEGGGAAEARP